MISRFASDRRYSRSGGFTFLELMVVMVLISLMTAFAVPGLRTSLFSDQLKTTTRKILGIVSEASQEAVSRNAEYFLYFDFDKNTVSTVQEDQPETERQYSADGREYPQGREFNIADAVQLVDITSVHGGRQSQGRVVVRFSKKGYVDKTLIHLRSEKGDDMTILLSPFLGVTKVFDSYINLDDARINY
ncbi:MAG: prepilin-type N-terminal cleavage/methylation domain-containing protein [Desulfobulbaceae bacterium]|nr:prepilin-type N-terminal cleavage/methylation domain-containing protein [Desulfobulbaceae bacterium]